LQSSALLFIVFFLTVAGFVAYVNVEVAPTIPPELFRPPTPTPDIFATPLSSPTPLGTPLPQRFTPTPPLAPTVTLASEGPPISPPGEEDGTAEATPVPPTSGVCSPLINISEPSNGDTVTGGVSIFGSAISADFAFYRLEINGPETGNQWASLLEDNGAEPVDNAFLGSANMGQWSRGIYTIRVVVVDNTNTEVGECAVQISLDGN
jgi:hypothetical protein